MNSLDEIELNQSNPWVVAYQCTGEWIYSGETRAEQSPLEEGVYLLPAFATFVSPPAYNQETQYVQFDPLGEAWEIVDIKPPSRDEIISAKTKDILALREKHNSSGFLAMNFWWQNDPESKNQWTYLTTEAQNVQITGGDMEAVILDDSGNPYSWRTMTGESVQLSANLIYSVTRRGAADQNKNYQNAIYHVAQLNLSQDPQNYDFSSGWSDIYQG
jgi:hypothetical protein